MCKETKREFFRVQRKNSRPLPHIFTRPLPLHSQISSPITCRHTARRSDPYHDQSARAILGTAFKGTRKTSSQSVFRLQAFSGHGTGNAASRTPTHWPHRGEHPIWGYRSRFCRAHQVPYQSQNRRKGLSCIVRVQSYPRIIPGSTTKPGNQWIPKKSKTAHRAPWASEEDIFRQWQNLCWRREVAQTSYAWREDTRLLSTWEHQVAIQPQPRRLVGRTVRVPHRTGQNSFKQDYRMRNVDLDRAVWSGTGCGDCFEYSPFMLRRRRHKVTRAYP